MICLSNSFILLQKLFKKVNLCLKKGRKKEKKLVRFHYHHRAIDQEPGT